MMEGYKKELGETIERAYNNIVEEIDIDFSLKIKVNCKSDDPEDDHRKADEILIELLEKMGFERTANSWRNVNKYYS